MYRTAWHPIDARPACRHDAPDTARMAKPPQQSKRSKALPTWGHDHAAAGGRVLRRIPAQAMAAGMLALV